MKILSAAILLAAAVSATAQTAPITVTASTDSAVILMGSQFHLTVTASVPSGQESELKLVNVPEINNPREGFGEYFASYVVATSTDTAVANGRSTVTAEYTLQGFDPGLYPLPVVGATTNTGDTVWAEMLTLKVLPMEVDTVTMAARPMAGIVPANCKWYDYIPLWLLWLLAGIAVAAAFAAVLVLTRKRKIAAVAAAAKPVPPFDLAMMRLEKLRQSGAAVPGHEKQFYTELTDILRRYLHGRFGINALEMTSSQILKALRSNPDTRMPAEQMNEVLKIADFVKFAKVKPLADDNQRSLLRATEFVQSTKPLPPPPPPSGKDATRAKTGTPAAQAADTQPAKSTEQK